MTYLQNQNSIVLSVSQLTQAIKQQIESTFSYVCVQGEVSNFKQQSSGHLYFSLKDSSSQISAVMFRGNANSLTRMPKNGDQIILKGEISVYPPRGNYQIIVRELKYAGLGDLLLKLEELKKEILRRGWFDQKYKKPLPASPQKIGVVTSPTGAAIQDILKILKRRSASLHLIINPVRVQGREAPGEISQAIDQFNKYNLVDVIIVARGGGSIEDLWAFNEEIVAASIFYSKIPIISAVGHETDHCISDYVADIRAATPSAAAEIVIADRAHQMHTLQQMQHRLYQTFKHMIHKNRQHLMGIVKQPVFASPYLLLSPYIQRLDDLRTYIDRTTKQHIQQKKLQIQAIQREATALNPTTKIKQLKQKLRERETSLSNNIYQLLNIRKERLLHIIDSLQLVNPKNLLKKGYSIVFSEKTNNIIVSVQDLKKNQKIRVLLSDGKIKAGIEEIL